MMKFTVVFQSMRVPFLVLTVACVFLGASVAVFNQTTISLPILMLALFGALLAHISVNTLNEYFDFKSGLDFETEKTQFSGGSGALPRNPEMLSAVFATSTTALIRVRIRVMKITHNEEVNFNWSIGVME